MVNVIFKAKSVKTGTWVEGFFTKKQLTNGGLFLPVIERIKECDNGDYMESIEIDGSTLQSKTEEKKRTIPVVPIRDTEKLNEGVDQKKRK